MVERIMLRALRWMVLKVTATVKKGENVIYHATWFPGQECERTGSNSMYCITQKSSPDPALRTKANH